MGVPTHGLHYFVHALLPLLKRGAINTGTVSTNGATVHCEGTNGVGFLKLEQALDSASEVAKSFGCAILTMRNPGKVGALRVYCQKLMDRDQIIIMLKNTARTVGIRETAQPVFGTNPLAIGLPGSDFIYDSSISTIATNKVRLAKKYGRSFPHPVGLDASLEQTPVPEDIAAMGGMLLPFSAGPFWFKSFFLGAAIEALASFSGGKTGQRVGEHKGSRLLSEEGFMAFVIDRSVSPNYDAYIEEIQMFFRDLHVAGLKLPGQYDKKKEHVSVLLDDWKEIKAHAGTNIGSRYRDTPQATDRRPSEMSG